MKRRPPKYQNPSDLWLWVVLILIVVAALLLYHFRTQHENFFTMADFNYYDGDPAKALTAIVFKTKLDARPAKYHNVDCRGIREQAFLTSMVRSFGTVSHINLYKKDRRFYKQIRPE